MSIFKLFRRVRLSTPVKLSTPMKWVDGLTAYGGKSIIEVDSGKVRGHAYILMGHQWWAMVDFSALDCFATLADAQRAVEQKLGAVV